MSGCVGADWSSIFTKILFERTALRPFHRCCATQFCRRTYGSTCCCVCVWWLVVVLRRRHLPKQPGTRWYGTYHRMVVDASRRRVSYQYQIVLSGREKESAPTLGVIKRREFGFDRGIWKLDVRDYSFQNLHHEVPI